MKPIIAVGLESTVDAWVTFPSLREFSRFAREYMGPLAEHVKNGYATVEAGKDDEIPIDGEGEMAQKLAMAAKEYGATVVYALGGNGAQETAALEALGSRIAFIGGFSPSEIGELPPDNRKFFEKADFSFARISDEYMPISVILQARGTNRYILCEGRGRRIEQLRSHLRDLPEALKRLSDKYGKLDMINLVGWHVLFGSGISDRDFRLVKSVMEKIRGNVNSTLFTDAGGFGAFDERERRLLCRIYSLYDILSVNENEVLQVSRAIGSETKDEFQALHDILVSLRGPSTIWLHSLDYQTSLSTKYEKKPLENAQIAAATAGVYRVEKGAYPTLEELARRRKIKNYSKRGLEAVKKARVYGGE